MRRNRKTLTATVAFGWLAAVSLTACDSKNEAPEVEAAPLQAQEPGAAPQQGAANQPPPGAAPQQPTAEAPPGAAQPGQPGGPQPGQPGGPQPGQPGGPQGAPTPGDAAPISDKQLDAFADAYLEAHTVQEELQKKLGSVESGDEARELQQAAMSEVKARVEKAGMDFQSYALMSQRLRDDRELQTRLEAKLSAKQGS